MTKKSPITIIICVIIASLFIYAISVLYTISPFCATVPCAVVKLVNVWAPLSSPVTILNDFAAQ